MNFLYHQTEFDAATETKKLLLPEQHFIRGKRG